MWISTLLNYHIAYIPKDKTKTNFLKKKKIHIPNQEIIPYTLIFNLHPYKSCINFTLFIIWFHPHNFPKNNMDDFRIHFSSPLIPLHPPKPLVCRSFLFIMYPLIFIQTQPNNNILPKDSYILEETMSFYCLPPDLQFVSSKIGFFSIKFLTFLQKKCLAYIVTVKIGARKW